MATKYQMEDVQTDAWHLLNLLNQETKSLTTSSLIRISKGMSLQRPPRALNPSRGALAARDSDRIRYLIRYLEGKAFMKRDTNDHGDLCITSKGMDFVCSPYPLIVHPRQLSQSKYEKEAFSRLRQLRRSLAKEDGCPAYLIFTDYTLEQLVYVQPQDLTQLAGIPGMNDFRINRYGSGILKILIEIAQRRTFERLETLQQKIKRPSYQEVKALFESGMETVEIANRRKVKISTIHQMLLDLFETDQINLKSWIEDSLEPEVLKNGKSYFEEGRDQRLLHAFRELGMGYETLKMCKLYVSHFSQSEEVLQEGD
ncbi:MAG: HRDC domain-containing protein [Bacteroidia bacterium]|nr:HRDC domain-containing protein [Bacteroidia bacterium]